MLFPFVACAAIIAAAAGVLLALPWPDWLYWLPALFVAAFLALALLYVLMLAVLSLFVNTKRERETPNRFYSAVVYASMGLICSACGVRARLEGEELIPRGTRWLLVSNHRSNFDPIAQGWLFRKHDVIFVSKASNLRIPVVGRLLKEAMYMAIDRENNREALKTIIRAANAMKNGVCSVGIYPEGTRNRGEGLLPFRSGALKAAQKAHVPIVVACINGSEKIARRAPFRRTDVTVKICGVIPADEAFADNTVDMSERLREMILAELR
jgi:1-acyl-sn-glycerol-3-phosphate acyltransferase